ncbi:MAG: sulfatase, partial [Vicinamibacteria bacterium]
MSRALAVLLTSIWFSSCGAIPSSKPSSVVLITIDTLRADRLGVGTPTLDALSSAGARFTNAFAQSPLTLPSHSSILTGTYPTYHGVRDNGRYRLSDEMVTLAEILKGSGHATAAFVGGFPVDSRFGLHQGFDVYDDVLGSSASRVGLAERRASDVISSARKWIGDRDRYFAWIHLFDPHAPYEPPPPFPSGYDGEIAYVDHSLKELLDAVSEDTLVVVTADHGEGLGEHGEATHSLFVYDSTLRIPLIFRGPGVPEGAVVEEPVRSIDILPTILDLVGEEKGCARCQGRSLLPALEGKDLPPAASYAETFFPRLNLGWSELRSLRKGGWKYIAAPEPEVYAVDTDPGESRNVASTNEDKLRELASELEKLTAGEELSAPAADAKTVAALRSLGYLMSANAPDAPATGPRPDPKSRLAVWESIRSGMELVARGEMEQAI